jgi:transcriptional regulator with GAF, ATPase, and Fis domain
MSREELLSATFVELADTLVNGYDVVDLLHTLAGRCVELADVDAAGIVLADAGGSLRVAASSSEAMRVLELYEVQNLAGPCLESYRTGQVVTSDLATDDRWPGLSDEAMRAGFHSVVALPMRLRRESIGALNLFRANRAELTRADAVVCQALADMATIGLLQERTLRESRLLAEQLQRALDSRVVLEQAKGVIAERNGVDVEAAFALMRRYARHRNEHLGAVAQAVIDGTLGPADLA